MTIKGQMIHGKFTDEGGRVYDITPKDAEIINTIGGDPEPTDQQTAPLPPPQTPPIPHSAEQPQAPAAPAQTLNPPAYPKCISYELLRAVQTPSMVQVSIRAHCKGQFADAVVHYDFEVYEQAPGTEIISFKQTAMKLAHAEAVEIARKLLCEQPEAKQAAKKEVKK